MVRCNLFSQIERQFVLQVICNAPSRVNIINKYHCLNKFPCLQAFLYHIIKDRKVILALHVANTVMDVGLVIAKIQAETVIGIDVQLVKHFSIDSGGQCGRNNKAGSPRKNGVKLTQAGIKRMEVLFPLRDTM